MEPIDFSKLPEPLPAEAESVAPVTSNPFAVTPQNQPVVSDLGQPFSLEGLPEPLPAEPAQRGTLADMGVAGAHGLESAIREGVKTFGSMLNSTVVPPPLREKAAELGESLLPDAMVPKPETIIGKIESDLVRFGLGFLAGGRIIKSTGVAANLAKSAVGTGIVADPQAERLSNIVESYPSLANPITEFLAAKDGDSTSESKFKASLEDVLTNSVAQLAFKTFKVAKGHLSGKISDTDAASMAEDILKTGAPKSATAPVVDPAIKATQAREAITPAWSPLKLSDEKAVQFKERLDSMFKDKSIEALPKNDGTVSVAHMDSSPNILNTVSELSKMIAPEMRAAGFTEHMSNQATKELAEQLSMTPDALIGGLKAAGASADQIAPMVLGGRMAIQGLAANIAKASQKALTTGEGKEAAIAEIRKFTELLSSFKSLQTGVARGLQVFGAKVGPHNVDDLATAMAGKEGDDLLKLMVMAEGDPTVISKLAQAAGTTWGRKAIDTHNELWMSALLSSPKSQEVNVLSTGLNMLVQPLNLVVGGTIRREWADVREGVALYTGLRQHLFDAFTMAKKSFLIDAPILSPRGAQEAGPAITAVNYGLDPESVIGQGVDFLGKTIRLPFRFLGTGDEFFKQMAYRSKLSAQAAREGMDLVKAGKLDQKDLATWITDRFTKGFNEAGAALDDSALKYAEKVAFSQGLKVPTWEFLGKRSFGETMMTVASTHPILRGTLLPFIKIPTNLARQTVDMSPAAVVRKQFWSALQEGGQARTEALGKISLGSAMWAGASYLAIEGTITGGGPVDKELRDALIATGWQPYSVKVGDKYISYSRLDPFGAVLGITANWVEIANHLPEKDRDNLAEVMTLSLVNNLTSKTYLKGLIDTLAVIGSGDERKVQKWLQMRAASYVPNAVGAFNPDTELKDVRSVMDAMKTKIPGYSSTVEAKRDFFGVKQTSPMGYPWSAFNPLSVSTDKKDAVRDEMARLAHSDAQAQWSQVPHLIGNVDLTTVKNAKGQTAYDRYTELIGSVTDGAGRNLYSAFEAKMNSSSYKNGSDGNSWFTTGSRVSMLRSVHDVFKDRALAQLKREFPEVADALRADKQGKLSMKKGREKADALEVLKQFGTN